MHNTHILHVNGREATVSLQRLALRGDFNLVSEPDKVIPTEEPTDKLPLECSTPPNI